MTTITDWKALLTAQLECLDALSEDDIGTEVFVRDFVDASWEGPYILKSIASPEDTEQPFDVTQGTRTMTYRLATKTFPIEPQTVTLIPWSGGIRPVDTGTFVIYQMRGGNVNGEIAGHLRWDHGSTSGDIIAYRPITIDIEEG